MADMPKSAFDPLDWSSMSLGAHSFRLTDRPTRSFVGHRLPLTQGTARATPESDEVRKQWSVVARGRSRLEHIASGRPG
jgi:hypothetical protein